MELKDLGLNAFFIKHFECYRDKNFSLGRICSEHKNSYKIYSEMGELIATISGKFRNNCLKKEDLPTVGDWVVFELIENTNKAIINAVLPRKSKFSRKIAGKETQEQIIVSNVDIAFIVCALNYDFNLRRIERYLSLIWQSGATPAIVLTKTDLCNDIESKLFEISNIAFGVDIHLINNITNEGVEPLKAYFKGNKTVVLLGSSGAGKSSLINNLLQENKMKVNILRNNLEKGRHTTTYKQMLMLPDSGLIIDTPGLRELQLWNAEDGISQCFQDIEKITQKCHFSNCTHNDEPKCAVRQAIQDGLLDANRFANYLKVKKEQEYLENRQNQSAAKMERTKWKAIHKQIKQLKK